MVSEEKLTAFLRLQQDILDIEESSRLFELSLPKVLEKFTSVGYPYIFISAVFINTEQRVQKTFFIDRYNNAIGQVTSGENLFRKGSEWEMKVLYGEAAVVSEIADLISPAYPQFAKIKSLLILPVQHIKQLTGVLVLASEKSADQVTTEEIEFAQMITRLIDLVFRLQDTEVNLTRITQQVYEMNARLHQLDKLKDDFVSIASHELRTPMTAIRSYAWMALHRSDMPLSKNLERYITRILISTERLVNLINDMLNISRIESGRIEINPEPIDLLSLVKDIVDEVYFSKSEEKKINFIVLEKPIPKAFADPEKLRQVFLNLVGNSLKFTPAGGKITFDFFTDGQTVEISVSDTGVGISQGDLSKLFHKFGRLDNSYTASATSGGTGLGLYISKHLVELMHGKIWGRSEGEGKGATFNVSLPVASPENLRNADQYRIKPAGEVKPLEPVAV